MTTRRIALKDWDGKLVGNVCIDPHGPATEMSDIILAAFYASGLVNDDEALELTDHYTMENLS